MALALRERSAAAATGRPTIARRRKPAEERAHAAKFRAGCPEEPLPSLALAQSAAPPARSKPTMALQLT